jgi:hypothetical protein
MNLIQRGTTASRANRGKSVKNSIAQRFGRGGYDGNCIAANLIQAISFAMYSENDLSTHLTHWEQDWKE